MRSPIWWSRQQVPLILATGLASLPILLLNADRSSEMPEYRFAYAIPFAATILAWRRISDFNNFAPPKWWFAVPIILMSWLMLLATAIVAPSSGTVALQLSRPVFIPWPAARAALALVSIALSVFAVGGWPLAWRLAPSWFLLWFGFRPTARAESVTFGATRDFIAEWANGALDELYRIPHLYTGNLVETSTIGVMVRNTTTPIFSLPLMLALVLFYLAWTRAPVYRGAAVFVSTIFWWTAVEIVRVVQVVFLASSFGEQWVDGIPGVCLNVGAFSLVLLLAISTDYLVLLCTPWLWIEWDPFDPFPPYAELDDRGKPPPKTRPMSRWAWGTVIAFCGLFLIQAPALLAQLPVHAAAVDVVTGMPDSRKASNLPETFEAWRRFGFDDKQTAAEANSVAWHYLDGTILATITLARGGEAWERRKRSYSDEGWERFSDEMAESAFTGKGVLDDTTELTMRRRDFVELFLIDKEWVNGTPSIAGTVAPTWRLELAVRSHDPLSADQQASARRLFNKALASVHDLVSQDVEFAP